jgi:ribosome-binding protein aMBF1 (putative translation factor)
MIKPTAKARNKLGMSQEELAENVAQINSIFQELKIIPQT